MLSAVLTAPRLLSWDRAHRSSTQLVLLCVFEPIVDDVEWRVVFSEKLMDDVDVDLI